MRSMEMARGMSNSPTSRAAGRFVTMDVSSRWMPNVKHTQASNARSRRARMSIAGTRNAIAASTSCRGSKFAFISWRLGAGARLAGARRERLYERAYVGGRHVTERLAALQAPNQKLAPQNRGLLKHYVI